MKRRPEPDVLPKARGTARQLPDHEVAELVAAYQAGATVYDLAKRFKIHRATVSLHLHRQAVQMRLQGLDDEQIEVAIQLYALGWSLAKLGTKLQVDPGTVHKALRQRGVQLRRPWERSDYGAS